MTKNRKATEEFILKYIDKLIPGSKNTDFYKTLFSNMSDQEFDTYINDLESGKRFLILTAPNFSDKSLSVERNLNIAKELKHDFFQKLWVEGEGDNVTYLTPIKYMVVDVPVRRPSQILIKKISVPKNTKTVDALTGQVTGESKGAKISYPELQVTAAMGLDNCMIELMKYRGGDQRGGIALTSMLSKLGTANLKVLSNYASGVESTKTLKTFLTAAHLKSTL